MFADITSAALKIKMKTNNLLLSFCIVFEFKTDLYLFYFEGMKKIITILLWRNYYVAFI